MKCYKNAKCYKYSAICFINIVNVVAHQNKVYSMLCLMVSFKKCFKCAVKSELKTQNKHVIQMPPLLHLCFLYVRHKNPKLFIIWI
jgi:hypothetical protein